MSIRTIAKDPADQVYFDYLADLRDSGAVNMFGASAFVHQDFAVTQKESREIVGRWVDSFKEAKA